MRILRYSAWSLRCSAAAFEVEMGRLLIKFHSCKFSCQYCLPWLHVSLGGRLEEKRRTKSLMAAAPMALTSRAATSTRKTTTMMEVIVLGSEAVGCGERGVVVVMLAWRFGARFGAVGRAMSSTRDPIQRWQPLHTSLPLSSTQLPCTILTDTAKPCLAHSTRPSRKP